MKFFLSFEHFSVLFKKNVTLEKVQQKEAKGRRKKSGRERVEEGQGQAPCRATSPSRSTSATNGHFTENPMPGSVFNSDFPGEKTLAWRVVK